MGRGLGPSGPRQAEAAALIDPVHRQQWKQYGLMFPLLYALAGQNPLTNHFEIEAGLEDGNYLPRARTR